MVVVRRHESERIFGTQLCGGKPDLLVPVAEALKAEIGDGLDFVDINCGCPIDLVYNKGAGSALLDHPSKLSKIVRGMNAVLGDTPLTIKLRTGTSAKQTTHRIFAKAQTEWGASAATLRPLAQTGGTRTTLTGATSPPAPPPIRDSVRQWNEEGVAQADEPEMVPIPIYGNGDVYSWQDYYERLDRTCVDGEMIARGRSDQTVAVYRDQRTPRLGHFVARTSRYLPTIRRIRLSHWEAIHTASTPPAGSCAR